MIIVPAGAFLMGSPEDEGYDNERPQHQVAIAKPFAIGLAPVKRGEFAAFIRETKHKIKLGAYAWDGRHW